jgi:serine/threonine protein kinase
MTLSDRVVDRLCAAIGEPDLSGTRYTLVRELGRGGMGAVYLVHDAALERQVALKILGGPGESLTIAALEHPGIVPVHDAGSLPDGRVYYAMKYVQGERLDRYSQSAASLAERLRVFLRICEPVGFAHARGVIHRDLKPANVMLGAFGEVLVLDWGAAHRLDAPADSAAGTAGYMAPEQMRGETSAQTDIYSLGKLLGDLIGPNPPKPLRAIAARASDPRASLRYPGVAALSADVARFLDGQPVSAYRESPLERAARWLARNRTLVLLIAAYLVARIAIFFFTRH